MTSYRYSGRVRPFPLVEIDGLAAAPAGRDVFTFNDAFDKLVDESGPKAFLPRTPQKSGFYRVRGRVERVLVVRDRRGVLESRAIVHSEITPVYILAKWWGPHFLTFVCRRCEKSNRPCEDSAKSLVHT